MIYLKRCDVNLNVLRNFLKTQMQAKNDCHIQVLLVGVAVLCLCLPEAAGAVARKEVVSHARASVSIRPELSLEVHSETGQDINLGTVTSAEDEPRMSRPVRVSVKVWSNLGTPYRVTQRVDAPLTNEEGKILATKNLLYTDPLVEGEGERDVESSPEIFVSDSKGLSENRTVIYKLRVPPGQAAGTYETMLIMAVTAQ